MADIGDALTHVTELEQKIGIAFYNRQLLLQALTHPSYLKENPSWPLNHNGRLRFLGEAVVDLALRERLLEAFPKRHDGELRQLKYALASSELLTSIAEEMGLGDFLLVPMTRARARGRFRERLLAETFQALTAALYEDLGYHAVKDFLETWLIPRLPQVVSEGLHLDPRTILRSEAQAVLGVVPVYQPIETALAPEEPHFVVGLYLESDLAGRGEGKTRDEAEADAARRVLRSIGWGKRGAELQATIHSLREFDNLSQLARAFAEKRQESA